MSETDAILFANEAFYSAFTSRDYSVMEAVWAEQNPVAVIHPGWNPIFGREAVMQSWKDILENPGAPKITCMVPKVVPQGRDAAAVLCYEEIDGNYLIATNLFVREGQIWRMTHHQAGPATRPPQADDPGANRPQRMN
jgi:hypothetical protein